jgi:hypothetical protein
VLNPVFIHAVNYEMLITAARRLAHQLEAPQVDFPLPVSELLLCFAIREMGGQIIQRSAISLSMLEL